MIDEVPVARSNQSDVRLKDHHPAARPQQLGGDPQLVDHGVAGLEVLEVVAHEDRPEVSGRQHAGQVETRRLDEPHVRREHVMHVPDVCRPALARLNPADEMAAVAGQVEERRARIHVALQEPDDLPPDGVLGADLALVEPRFVEFGEEPRHRRPASSSARIHGTTSSSIASRLVVASKPEDLARLADVGHAQLDVVLERRIGDVAERLAVAADLAPDGLGQLEDRRRGRGRQVEVVVDGVLRLHRQPDAVGQVATVGVVADLVALAQDVERVLALEDLDDEVRDDVGQRQLDVAAHDVTCRGPPDARRSPRS